LKVILTCAFPQPGYELPHRVLEAAGLVVAARARAEDITPTVLHDRIMATDHATALQDLAASPVEQLAPDKIWQNLATEVFLGNHDVEAWGWVDFRLVYLLDFWKSFDPKISFVLAYESPAATLGGVLESHPLGEEEIVRILGLWQDFNTELLRFYYSHRERCLLVNSGAVRHSPQSFAERAAHTFGVDLPPGRACLATPPPTPADALLREYLAEELVRDRDEPRMLYEELESAADFPLVLPQTSASHAWNDYVHVLSAHEAALMLHSERLEALALERSSLVERQTELEQLVQAVTQARDEQASLAMEREARLAAADSASTAIKAELEKVKQESELILLQLHQVQEELEQQWVDKQKEVQALTQARDGQTKLAAERLAQVEAVTKARQSLEKEKSALAESRARLEEEVRVQAQARDGQANLAAERLAQIEARNQAMEVLQQERSALTARSEEHVARINSLTKTKGELERLVQSLTQSRDEQARLATERGAQLAAAQSVAASHPAKLEKLQEQHDALAKKNELLLLQLHQVQEELESYYVENQKLLARGDPQPSPRVTIPELLPAEVLYDLRREIDGDNWYYAEHDGRWAGPEACSTLRVPAMAPGCYRLELFVVDAMEPEIVAGMALTLNGRSLAMDVEPGNRYPKLVKANITVDESDVELVWEFAFRFPKLVSPAERGSDDQRHLAIRVASLCVKLQDQSARWLQRGDPIPWWAIWKRVS
jgi:hypothetical protein